MKKRKNSNLRKASKKRKKAKKHKSGERCYFSFRKLKIYAINLGWKTVVLIALILIAMIMIIKF